MEHQVDDLNTATSNNKLSSLMVSFIVCALFAIILWFSPHPIIIVIIAILPIALWSVVNYSFIIILGFIIFSFFRIHEVIPILIPLKIPLLLALASLFIISWKVIITKNLNIYWSREFSLLTAFLF